MKIIKSIILVSLLMSVISESLAEKLSAPIRSAIKHSERSEADRARDTGRKPGLVLQFSGIEPGQTVLDLFSGGGYYTEILSHYVGGDGRVVAHNNKTYQSYLADQLKARYQNGRLVNVEQLVQEANDLDLGAEAADVAFLVLSYHDIYYVDESWPVTDRDTFLANIHRALKPGGLLLVIDHRARSGAPPESGNTLHRIDPVLVKNDLERAGFVFERETGFLANPSDSLKLSVFDPAIKGKTDRFVQLYRKPSM